jgi:hypothetical protein
MTKALHIQPEKLMKEGSKGSSTSSAKCSYTHCGGHIFELAPIKKKKGMIFARPPSRRSA